MADTTPAELTAPAEPTMAEVMAAIQALGGTVGALAEDVAQLKAADATEPVAPTEPPTFVMSQDSGYEPLVPQGNCDDVALLRRLAVARALGIIGTPAGEECMEHGARGLYRQLERGEGHASLADQIPHSVALLLIADANTEDHREAIEMSHELLKVWDETPPPEPGEGVVVELKAKKE